MAQVMGPTGGSDIWVITAGSYLCRFFPWTGGDIRSSLSVFLLKLAVILSLSACGLNWQWSQKAS